MTGMTPGQRRILLHLTRVHANEDLIARREPYRTDKAKHKVRATMEIIDQITLNQSYETLVGKQFLLVAIQNQFSLAGKVYKSTETLVCYDHLGANEGDLIAVSENRETCMPFYPERRVPLDAYNSAILDRVVIELEV